VARFTDPDEARAFLNSLSDHPDRPGDTSKLHPQFAIAMANAIADAREAGLPVRLMSGQREGNVTNSRYDRGGYSSHIYGLASDVEGIGLAGSDTAQKWRQIAQANGLSSPYDPRGTEWNHWQFGPKLENAPDLLAQLRQAHAAGDTQAMWNAYVPSSITQPTATVSHLPANLLNRGTGSRAPIAAQQSGNESHEQFIRDYAQKIGVNPDLAVGIANAEGLRAWSAKNPNAGSYVDRTNGVPWSFGDFQLNTRNGMGVDALKAGIDPRDPKQWQAADRFAIDQMKAGGISPWKGDKFAVAWGDRPVMGAGTAAAPNSTTLTTNPITNPGPMDPSAQAHGSTVNPPIPDAPGVTTPQPNFVQKLFTRPEPTKDAQGNDVQGKSPIEKLAGSLGGAAKSGQQQQASAPTPATFAPVQDPMAGMAPAAAQLYTTIQAQAAKPLSWTSRPYGWDAGLQTAPGMSLNTTGYGYGS
jgi:hypothetical protein